jgi:hypothetical protein
MAASSLARVDLPDPELPTTDTRCTIEQPNTRARRDGTHFPARPLNSMVALASSYTEAVTWLENLADR